jgi:hypothetical protein
MVLKTRNGFQLSGHLNGSVCPPAHRYQKSTTANADNVIYVGDPISLTSAGTVSRLHANTSAGGAQNGTFNYLGVCTGIYETEDGRPLTHRTNKYAATADAFWIDVIDDPDAVWEVSYGATANQTVMGSLAGVQYATPVTAAGISGAGLSSAQPAATADATMFRVIQVVNLDRDGANSSNNDQDGRVRVIANNHIFRNTAAF